MSQSHTPGPHAIETLPGNDGYLLSSMTGEKLATVHAGHKSLADAKLFAVSPQLLVIAEAFLDVLEHPGQAFTPHGRSFWTAKIQEAFNSLAVPCLLVALVLFGSVGTSQAAPPFTPGLYPTATYDAATGTINAKWFPGTGGPYKVELAYLVNQNFRPYIVKQTVTVAGTSQSFTPPLRGTYLIIVTAFGSTVPEAPEEAVTVP